MTIIIGYKENDKIYLGADSRISCGGSIFSLTDEKVFKKDNILLGFTGNWRAAQIIKYKFEPPERPCKMTTEKYLNTIFIDELRECLKENGYAKIDNNVEKAHGAYLVIGIDNRLFDMGYDYGISESTDDFVCSGSGEEYARGAMHALESTKIPSEERIKIALEAACRFNNGCSPPFTIITS